MGVFFWDGEQKNRMSHDVRFSKTNYLKTNLLKQIKKIFLTMMYLCYLVCKINDFC